MLDGTRARFGAPPLDAARRSTWEPRGSFLLAGAALQALDGARARFGAPPLDAARRSTFEPRGSFLLAGAALQALDGTRARFGAPPFDAARRSTLDRRCQARFCWQGQHFRLWTVPERVSGPPPLDAARRSTREPRGSFLLAGAALQALDGTRARFGALPGAPRGSFLLAGAALQALDGTRARFGAPPLDAARRSTFEPRASGSGRCPSAFRGPPPLVLPGAALLSLAARFCWQGQHFRLWTVPERVSGPPSMLPEHLGASRLVSAGRGSTSGSGRYPSAFRGPPP